MNNPPYPPSQPPTGQTPGYTPGTTPGQYLESLDQASLGNTPNPPVQEVYQAASLPADAGGWQAPSANGWQAPSVNGSQAPSENKETRVTARETRRTGPGWGALSLAMLTTSALTAGIFLSFGVGQLPFTLGAASATNRMEAKQVTSVVTPVEGGAEGVNWEAVSAAVRPATVSINVNTESGGSAGSGVVWDNAGHIVTNHHVVDGATGKDAIIVIHSDGRVFRAKLVGADPTTDLAVIKLEDPPADLVAGNFGSSADLKIGQPVLAVGAPLGLSDTSTTGIISALNRPVSVQPSPQGGFLPDNPGDKTIAEPVITNAIQVDASINPGNSGGPLFDATGRVIGINSSIASNTGGDQAGSIGLGFAIPVDLVRNVVTQIIDSGKVVHAQLGVSVSNGVANSAEASRLGAEIREILPGSAAAEAGLQNGDVITSVDGNTVVSGRSLTGYIRRYRPGDTVKLQVVREGKVLDVEVALRARAGE